MYDEDALYMMKVFNKALGKQFSGNFGFTEILENFHLSFSFIYVIDTESSFLRLFFSL